MWSIKSDRVNLVAPASPVHRARYSTNRDQRLTRLGNLNVLRRCPCTYFAHKLLIYTRVNNPQIKKIIQNSNSSFKLYILFVFGEPLPQFVLFLISDVIKGTIKSPLVYWRHLSCIGEHPEYLTFYSITLIILGLRIESTDSTWFMDLLNKLYNSYLINQLVY